MNHFTQYILLILLSPMCFCAVFAQETSTNIVNQGESERMVQQIADSLEVYYVNLEMGKKIGHSLKEKSNNGIYKKIKDPKKLAIQLTTDLRAVNGDKHLSVNYRPIDAPKKAPVSSNKPNPSGRISNYGFEKVEILDGNVGYLKIKHFSNWNYITAAKAAASASMNMLSNADALIFDVRDNRGGVPMLVSYLISYLFDGEPVHLTDYVHRYSGGGYSVYTENVIGKRLPEVPVYILVNQNSASAAEEFAYWLKHQDRATIIGETTMGAGYGAMSHRLNDKFMVSISSEEERNPITGTNFEQVGVVPNIKTSNEAAFDKAKKMATEAAETYRSKQLEKSKKLTQALEKSLEAYGTTASEDEIIKNLTACQQAGLLNETSINRMGYEYLRNQKLPTALVIFKTNTLLYSNSANVFDSYAESQLLIGKTENAIENYKKAVDLAEKNKLSTLSLFKENLEKTKMLYHTLTSSPEAKIDNYIERILKRNGVPGASLAIIKDGKVIHKKNYGYTNLEHQVPISNQSIFRLYSLTKPFVSIALFKLIEEGKISLEDKVSKYINDLPDTWQDRQIKHLLSHSSGFPDMGQPYLEIKDLTEDEAIKRVFGMSLGGKAGEKYEYNQTNFWMLQRIIDQLSQQPMAEFIREHQFPTTTDTVFFSSDSRDIVKHRVTPYFPFAKGELSIEIPYVRGNYSLAMNGMHIGLSDFITWDKKFKQNQFISSATKEKMWANFPYSQTEDVFAYGWGKYNVNGHPAYGFSGSGSTIYRIFPEDDLSIIYLANGFSAWYDMGGMMNYIASMVDEDIFDPSGVVNEKLLAVFEKGNSSEFKNIYTQLKNENKYQNVNFENCVNRLGYTLLRQGNVPKAIEVFKLNTEEFPSSWNVYDSLGEAYEANQQPKKALMSYQKALQLNTKNELNHNVTLKEKIEKLSKK